MLVEYDDQAFYRQRVGGVSRYFAALIGEFLADESLDVQVQLPFRFTRSTHLGDAAPDLVRLVREGGCLDTTRSCRLANRLAARRGRNEGTVFHPTMYAPSALSGRNSHRLVTTIHDMIPELLPQYYSRNPHEGKIMLAERSDAVLCVSATARDDLLRMSRVRPENTFVTPEAAEMRSLHDISSASRARRLLYVGHRTAYKNFETLLKALARVRETEFEVLCVGGGSLTSTERALVTALPSGVRLRQCNLSEHELRDAYLTSAALVSTSLAEGFGLPVLEALGAGCPVLLSDIPVYREFWSGLDGFFAPTDAGALAAAIDVVLGLDGETLRARGRAGWQLAQAFSWKATAAATSDVYHRVLGR